MAFITSLHNYIIVFNIYLLLLRTYISSADPHFDPFCIWGNEIIMNKHQVRKLRKIVRRKRWEMSIKLFVYALSKTTVNFRMVRTIHVTFFFPAYIELLVNTV